MLSEYTAQRAEVLNKLNIPEVDTSANLKFLWFDIVTSSNITKRIYTGIHSHSFLELQFVFSGRVNYECNGQNVELKKGQALFIPEEMPHKYLGCDDELLKGAIAFSIEKSDLLNLPESNTFDIPCKIASNTDFILKRCEKSDMFTPNIVFGRMLEILCSVCDSLNIYIPGYIEQKCDSRLLFAKNYIEKNKDTVLSCEDVAKECGISSKQLSRIFKNNLDCSLYEYIIRVRIKNAKSLLKNPENSIKKVGYSLGFENESGFVSFFKRHCGVSPGVYRKSQMSEN